MVIPKIHLNACGLAPSSVCPFDKKAAVRMMTAILASSEGWKATPKKVSQRAAPFTRSPEIKPINMTTISMMTDTSNNG